MLTAAVLSIVVYLIHIKKYQAAKTMLMVIIAFNVFIAILIGLSQGE